jgi:hypothetical protein
MHRMIVCLLAGVLALLLAGPAFAQQHIPYDEFRVNDDPPMQRPPRGPHGNPGPSQTITGETLCKQGCPTGTQGFTGTDYPRCVPLLKGEFLPKSGSCDPGRPLPKDPDAFFQAIAEHYALQDCFWMIRNSTQAQDRRVMANIKPCGDWQVHPGVPAPLRAGLEECWDIIHRAYNKSFEAWEGFRRGGTGLRAKEITALRREAQWLLNTIPGCLGAGIRRLDGFLTQETYAAGGGTDDDSETGGGAYDPSSQIPPPYDPSQIHKPAQIPPYDPSNQKPPATPPPYDPSQIHKVPTVPSSTPGKPISPDGKHTCSPEQPYFVLRSGAGKPPQERPTAPGMPIFDSCWSAWYDKFYDTILFPIFDTLNRGVAFSAWVDAHPGGDMRTRKLTRWCIRIYYLAIPGKQGGIRILDTGEGSGDFRRFVKDLAEETGRDLTIPAAPTLVPIQPGQPVLHTNALAIYGDLWLTYNATAEDLENWRIKVTDRFGQKKDVEVCPDEIQSKAFINSLKVRIERDFAKELIYKGDSMESMVR